MIKGDFFHVSRIELQKDLKMLPLWKTSIISGTKVAKKKLKSNG